MDFAQLVMPEPTEEPDTGTLIMNRELAAYRLVLLRIAAWKVEQELQILEREIKRRLKGEEER